MTPIESPVPKTTITLDAIDLTNDDTEPQEASTDAITTSAQDAIPNKKEPIALEEASIAIHELGDVARPIFLEDDDSEDDSDAEADATGIDQDYDDSDEDCSVEEDSDKENENESDDDTPESIKDFLDDI